ncbi:MAG: glycerol kinase GlpK [Flavobacteriales bacterium]|nr:glycerol kinase GlpK [Flavobacteriales bacterium]
MEKKYVLALDQGTTSSRALLFDQQARLIAMEQEEFTQYFPHEGWVEHEPLEIWESQQQVMHRVLEKAHVDWSEIASIGITNQRETAVAWDARSGRPLGRAIVWQDQRTRDICASWKAREEEIRAKTGLVPDTYFSASKFKWLLEHIRTHFPEVSEDDIRLGTVDSWLLWNMTGGEVFATDLSNASRTLLFNIHELDWDSELLAMAGVSRSSLPQVKPSDAQFGHYRGVPICAVMGDQQSALFGQLCWEKGMAKNTYGTGCFMLMNTGHTPNSRPGGLISTIAWGWKGSVSYATEGSVFVAGAAIQWLRDGLEILQSAAESEGHARNAVDNTVYVVPAFAGLGAPYWDMDARGAVFGLTRGSDKSVLIQATLESLAYQTGDIFEAMVRESGQSMHTLAVDGGACANDYLMQFQSDILQIPVERPTLIESTACGVAYMSGMTAGLWSEDEVKKFRTVDREFLPQMEKDEVSRRIQGWKLALDCTRRWKSPWTDNNK